MNFSCITAFVLGFLLLTNASAWAQTSTEPTMEEAGLVLAANPPASGPTSLNLASYGLVEFQDYRELYGQLTAPGRCPLGKMASEHQPCAFIFYESDAGKINFKPIFKIESSTKMLAIHNRRLKEISIENLYFDEVTIRGKPEKYTSVAVIGNEENTANCVRGDRCLAQLIKEDIFRMYHFPQLVVDVVWHNRRLDPSVKMRSGQ